MPPLHRILGLAAAVLVVATALAQEPANPLKTDPKTPPTPSKEDTEKAEKSRKASAAAQAAQREIWRTAYRPTRIPDRVILTFNGDPATSMAATWRTDTLVTRGVAQIARSEAGPGFDSLSAKVRPNPEKVKTMEARTEGLETDLFDSNYHSVTLTGLKPDTRYVYRVGDGSVWSEWFEFRTALDRPAPLSFIYFGDAQNDVKSQWSRVVRGAYSDMPKAHFILHAGDLIDRANSDGQWGEWHQAAGWINGMIPSVPTPGNHEYAAPTGSSASLGSPSKSRISGNWRPQFTLPENGPPGLEESTYYFDIQGVRIISLNSNEMEAEQVKWMEQVLANNPNKWTVITFHHPIYSTAKGRDNKKLRELWRPVFDRYTPDLVLQGHDHSYGRSGVMREDNLLTGARLRDEKGSVYVVSVSGPKMYALESMPWAQSKVADTQLYQLIRIDGDVLHYEARTANGEVFDKFDLFKPGYKPTAQVTGGATPEGFVGEASVPPASLASDSRTAAWVTLGVFGGVILAVVGRRVLTKSVA